MIPPELEAKIIRLRHVEKWPIGTIAKQLRIHHEVVRRVLDQDGIPKPKQVRLSMIDEYVSFIVEQWSRYPSLTASRLFVMCKERGYPGRPDHFRHQVARLRPKPRAEAYLRLKTLPGEQAQVDWAHFGKIEVGRAKRPLMAFVFVLSWSRALFLRFFLGQQTENFLRGHEQAFECLGVPRVILYDNLKSAVLERVGDAIRFNPTLLKFAAHYRYEPRPVAPGRGNEKARVERAIRYVRSSFFAARKWRGLDDLNSKVDAWCMEEALQRRWPEDKSQTVGEALNAEREKLLPLPDTRFPTDEQREVSVGKTPYLRFDKNDYSVPHRFVRSTLTVFASPTRVRVFDGLEEIASHPRCFDKGRQIEDPAHVQDLVLEKRKARKGRGLDRLAHAAPSSRGFLEQCGDRGLNIGSTTNGLLRLLDTFGSEALEAALAEVLSRGVPHLHAVRQALETARSQRGQPPQLPLTLPDDPRVRDLSVRPHDLKTYDAITKREEDDDEQQ